LVDGAGGLFFSCLRSIVIPTVGVVGVRAREEGPEFFTRPVEPGPSPSRTRVSIDLSKFPLSPFKTARFRLSSLNPIFRSLAIFISISSEVGDPTSAPNNLEGLFLLGGEGDLSRGSGRAAAAAASRLAFDDNGKMDEVDLKPNLLPVFGGRGGGWSSEVELPVSCRVAAFIDFS
jgi:hypothetical protein